MRWRGFAGGRFASSLARERATETANGVKKPPCGGVSLRHGCQRDPLCIAPVRDSMNTRFTLVFAQVPDVFDQGDRQRISILRPVEANGKRPVRSSRFGFVLGGEAGRLCRSRGRFWFSSRFSIQKHVWELGGGFGLIKATQEFEREQ